MTKERYLEVRELPEIPLDDWFDYYQERGGLLSRADFEATFVDLLYWEKPVIIKGEIKVFKFKSALDNFYLFYNKKFYLNL